MKRVFWIALTLMTLASLVPTACAPAAEPTAPPAEQPAATEETAPMPKEVTLTIGFSLLPDR